jgi:hypothetical protein
MADQHHENPQERFIRQVVERLDELVLIEQQDSVKQDAILKAIQALALQTTETAALKFGAPAPKEK